MCKQCVYGAVVHIIHGIFCYFMLQYAVLYSALTRFGIATTGKYELLLSGTLRRVIDTDLVTRAERLLGHNT